MLDLSRPLHEILFKLLSIDSTTGREAYLSKVIETTLSKLHLENIYNDNGNLVYYKHGTANNIALIGHIDTVPPFIPPRLTKNILYGRGSVDMKAGVAVILKLIYELNNISLNNGIYFVFYTGEEGPLPNGLSKILKKDILRNIKEAIILEPSNDKVAVACLGTASFMVELKGLASHSANPQKGENAIYNAVSFIQYINNFDTELRQKTYKNAFPTINITQINTINPKNIIPDSVNLTINLRFTPSMKINFREDAINYINNIIPDELKKNIKKISLIDFAEAVDNINPNIDIPKKTTVFQAWTDIAQLAKYNIHGIIWGPGKIELAHSKNEHINIDELNKFYSDMYHVLKANT